MLEIMQKKGTNDQYLSKYFEPIFKNKKGKRYSEGSLRKIIERGLDLGHKKIRKEIPALLEI